MKTILNERFRQKYDQIYAIEPNRLGPPWLTFLYKKSTSPLKSMPFFVIIPCSMLVAGALYLMLGRLSITLVSLLQYGF